MKLFVYLSDLCVTAPAVMFVILQNTCVIQMLRIFVFKEFCVFERKNRLLPFGSTVNDQSGQNPVVMDAVLLFELIELRLADPGNCSAGRPVVQVYQ